MYIATINLNSWQDYVTLHENTDTTPYIFRGQSNSIGPNGDFIKWRVESSFNRFYTKKFSLQFSNMLNQHLETDLFKFYYSQYSYGNITNLAMLNSLQKCFYLQHYGLPTCLIDFTTDPLIAMYFAMSAIQGTSSLIYDGDGNCIHFSNDVERDFVSIYRLNCNILRKHFCTKDIDSENFDSFLNSYATHYHLSKDVNVKIGLIINPQKEHLNNNNYNLLTQKGCFLLFDNEKGIDLDCNRNQNIDFIRFLEIHEQYYKLTLPEPVVTIFKIGYNSFMNARNRFNKDGIENISAFQFLKRKDLIGKNLFSDIQGLKYDFNFFYSR